MQKLIRVGVTIIFAAFLLTTSVLSTEPVRADDSGHFGFQAFGGFWVAAAPKWIEIEGKWLVDAPIRLAGPPSDAPTIPQMVSSFCENILQIKPNAPDRFIQRSQVFRVNLNIFNLDGVAMWPYAVPVPVSDGKCRVKEGIGIYYPSYPQQLEGWRLFHIGVQEVGGEFHRIQISFQLDPDRTIEPKQFDYEKACRATLADPLPQHMRALVEHDAKLQNITVRPDEVMIILTLPPEADTDLGMFIGNIFDTSSGECVEVK